ncbi:MAG TPA: tripartite tricarboxylate transporter substrate binding protein, partial [Xanthobacteraceae bacterium]|nr:tripartite tricarboxylate transporter substrate binding protein [Xanthobacteraceae bacterium]
MRRLQLILVAIVSVFATGAAAEFPDRPIHLVVPQAAGSATDTLARIFAAALSEQIGQQVVVDDRPGGALTVGLDV